MGIAGSILVTLFITGCGSDESSGVGAQAVKGPLDYDFISSRYKRDLSDHPYEHASLKTAYKTTYAATATNSETNGSTVGSAADDINFAAGVIGSLIPEAGIVLGPVGAMSGLISSMEVANEINELQQDVQELQNEINTLQAEFNAASVFYANFVNQQQAQWDTSALKFWQNAINTADSNNTTTSSYYGNMLNILGRQSMNDAAINVDTMTQLSELSANSQLPYSLASLANGLSGSTFTANATPLYMGVKLDINATAGNPSVICAPSDSKQTIDLLACQLNYLLTQLPTPGTQGSNVIPTIDAYNNQVMMIWQNSLTALQYLYMTEATVSYLNYLNYKAYLGKQVPNLDMQIIPFEQTSNMLFSVGTDLDQIDPSSPLINALNLDTTFNQYQLNLLLVYAARVNALYQTVMSYIVSDPMIPGQFYTSPPEFNGKTLPAQESLYTTVPTYNLISSVENKSVPRVYGNGVLYQYNGINQLWSCAGPSVTKKVKTPSGSTTYVVVPDGMCQSAFPSSNASTYDGVNINAYYCLGECLDGSLTLTSNTLNTNDGLCASPAYPTVWGWVGGELGEYQGSVMTCGNWGGSSFVNSNMAGGTGSSYMAPYVERTGSCTTGNACQNKVFGTGSNRDYNYYMQSSDHGSYMLYIPYTYTLVASSSGSGEYRLGGADYGDYGNGIHDGEISGHSPHYAFLTITLQNGYKLPLYFMTYQDSSSGHTFSMLVCPNTMGVTQSIPGLVYCSQQNTNGDGGIQFETADGQWMYMGIDDTKGAGVSGTGNGNGYGTVYIRYE